MLQNHAWFLLFFFSLHLSLRHGLPIVELKAKWLLEKKRNVHHVEQLEKSVPFITNERSFSQDVSELAMGVDTFHLDHWVKIDPV